MGSPNRFIHLLTVQTSQWLSAKVNREKYIYYYKATMPIISTKSRVLPCEYRYIQSNAYVQFISRNFLSTPESPVVHQVQYPLISYSTFLHYYANAALVGVISCQTSLDSCSTSTEGTNRRH